MHNIEYFQQIHEEIKTKADFMRGREVVDYVLDNENAFDAFWHPLGFINVDLWVNEHSSLRLHVWPTGAKHALEQAWKIHDHIYSFKSAILAGKIRDSRFSVREHKAGTKFVYKVKYLHDGSVLVDADVKCDIDSVKINVYGVGDMYECPKQLFHYSDACGESGTITLMATFDKLVNVNPRVLVDRFVGERVFRPRVNAEIDGYAKIRQIVGQCLGKA